jgi:hypothetical protein
MGGGGGKQQPPPQELGEGTCWCRGQPRRRSACFAVGDGSMVADEARGPVSCGRRRVRRNDPIAAICDLLCEPAHSATR